MRALFGVLFLCSVLCARSEEVLDPGKEVIGQLEVSLIYGSAQTIDQGYDLPVVTQNQLRKTKSLNFSHYRLLGTDQQGILRSYLFWATPVKSKKPIMLSFQPMGAASADTLQLDLELWQGTKKILKTDPTLKTSQPLFILGPEWRDGRIIISVKLLSLK